MSKFRKSWLIFKAVDKNIQVFSISIYRILRNTKIKGNLKISIKTKLRTRSIFFLYGKSIH